MTKRHALNDLSEAEIYEFVGPDVPMRLRRYPPSSDDMKLTADEVESALKGIPDGLSPEGAKEQRVRRLGEALLAKREMALVDGYTRAALGPEPCAAQCEAMQLALGHMYRLGGMYMRSHQALPTYTPVVKAAAAASARKSRSAGKERRDEIVDSQLQAHPRMATKRLLVVVNAKLKEIGYDKASLAYLYGRRKILGLTEQES